METKLSSQPASYAGEDRLSILKHDIQKMIIKAKRKGMVKEVAYLNTELADHAQYVSLRIPLNLASGKSFRLQMSFLKRRESQECFGLHGNSQEFFVIVNPLLATSVSFRREFLSVIEKKYRGFKTEEVAELVMQEAIKSGKHPFLQKVRHGTDAEDKRGIDFFVKVKIRDKTFEFFFDLKGSHDGHLLAAENPDHAPTIWMRYEDIQSNPEGFIKKLEALAGMMYRKMIKKESYMPHTCFHI